MSSDIYSCFRNCCGSFRDAYTVRLDENHTATSSNTLYETEVNNVSISFQPKDLEWSNCDQDTALEELGLSCPISTTQLVTPVKLSCGHCFSEEGILEWFDSGHSTCPVDRQDVDNNLTLDNRDNGKQYVLDYYKERSRELGVANSPDTEFNPMFIPVPPVSALAGFSEEDRQKLVDGRNQCLVMHPLGIDNNNDFSDNDSGFICFKEVAPSKLVVKYKYTDSANIETVKFDQSQLNDLSLEGGTPLALDLSTATSLSPEQLMTLFDSIYNSKRSPMALNLFESALKATTKNIDKNVQHFDSLLTEINTYSEDIKTDCRDCFSSFLLKTANNLDETINKNFVYSFRRKHSELSRARHWFIEMAKVLHKSPVDLLKEPSSKASFLKIRGLLQDNGFLPQTGGLFSTFGLTLFDGDSLFENDVDTTNSYNMHIVRCRPSGDDANRCDHKYWVLDEDEYMSVFRNVCSSTIKEAQTNASACLIGAEFGSFTVQRLLGDFIDGPCKFGYILSVVSNLDPLAEDNVSHYVCSTLSPYSSYNASDNRDPRNRVINKDVVKHMISPNNKIGCDEDGVTHASNYLVEKYKRLQTTLSARLDSRGSDNHCLPELDTRKFGGVGY